MNPAAASYLTYVEGRLRRAGFSVQRRTASEQRFPLVALRTFGMSKDVGLGPNIVVFSAFETLDWDEVGRFTGAALDHLVANHPEFSVGRRMMLYAPVAVVPAVDEATRAALMSRKGAMRYRRFASFPVAVETGAGRAHYRAKTPVIGAAYARGFRRLAALLAPADG